MKQDVVIAGVIILLFFVFFFSCKDRKESQALLHIESIMEEHPDSAFKILEGISTEHFSSYNKAWYYLLQTQVADKNKYSLIPYDSVMDIALTYFALHEDVYKRSRSYFYAGKIKQKKGCRDEAYILYNKALADSNEYKKENFKLFYFINYYLGKLCYDEVMLDKSLNYYNRAYKIVEGKDSLYTVFSLIGIGDVHLVNENNNYAKVYFDKALAFTQGAYFYLHAGILSKISTLYDNMGDLDNSLLFLEKAIKCNQKKNEIYPYCLSKGILYFKTEQNDSAYFYLSKASQKGNLKVQTTSLLWLSKLEGKKKQYFLAWEYLKKHNEFKDSLEKNSKAAEIIKLERKITRQNIIAKDNKIAQTRKYFIFTAIVGGLVSITMGMVFWNQYNHKKISLMDKERILKDTENMRLKEATEALELRNQLLIQTQEVDYLTGKVRDMKRIIERLEDMHQKDEEMRKDLEQKKKELRVLKCLADERAEDVSNLFEKVILTTDIGSVIQRYDFASETTESKRNKITEGFTESDWEQFINTIKALVPNFINHLKDKYPELTIEDIQFCCLLKARIKTAVIANILGVTQDAVYKKINTVLSKRMRSSGKKAELDRILVNI